MCMYIMNIEANLQNNVPMNHKTIGIQKKLDAKNLNDSTVTLVMITHECELSLHSL